VEDQSENSCHGDERTPIPRNAGILSGDGDRPRSRDLDAIGVLLFHALDDTGRASLNKAHNEPEHRFGASAKCRYTRAGTSLSAHDRGSDASRPSAVRPRASRPSRHFAGAIIGQLVPNMTRAPPSRLHIVYEDGRKPLSA